MLPRDLGCPREARSARGERKQPVPEAARKGTDMLRGWIEETSDVSSSEIQEQDE